MIGLTVCLPPIPKARDPCPHCSTCPRVSGSFRARELPRARAAEAKRIGAALVMPTKEVKMLIPSTAASLHRAFRKPKAVVLLRRPRAKPHGGQGPEDGRQVGEKAKWGKTASSVQKRGGRWRTRGEGGNTDRLGDGRERRQKHEVSR